MTPKIKKLIALILFFSLFLTTSFVFAEYQFENYEWGQALIEIKTRLETEKKNIEVFPEKSKLEFNDKIFDKDCKVALGFTPKTNLLYLLEIHWYKMNIGVDIKKVLTEKYGMPEKDRGGDGSFIWGGSSGDGGIFLNISPEDTSLIYYSTRYMLLFDKEMGDLGYAPKGE